MSLDHPLTDFHIVTLLHSKFPYMQPLWGTNYYYYCKSLPEIGDSFCPLRQFEG